MKVCPKCGKQYAADANFCTNDAGRLVAMSSSASTGPPPAAAAAVASAASAASAAAVAVAPAIPLLGGRFELRERVGGGVTGAVHKAIDTQNGAAVAIKLIAPAVVAQHAQRVERELKLLEKVQSPAVARVLSSGKQGDQLWAAMEWVEGGVPLSQMVGASGIEPEKASEFAIAVGGALVEAAKVGVVHRDLAPKNVLVANGAVKLINFALPVPNERVSGVPAFVSPEVIEGKQVDQRSSTYSLGALYYFLLTGQPPFTGDPQVVHAAHLSGSAVPPSQRAAVAADVDTLVGRAMDRNPAKRYLTLKQFLDDIDRVKKGPEGGTSSTAPFGRAGAAAGGLGKRREPAATMLGVGSINEARTKQMDVQIPPEAMRDAAALDAAVAARAATERPASLPLGGASGSAPETVSQAIAAHAATQPQTSSMAQPQAPAPAPGPAAASPWAAPAVHPGPMTPAVHAVQAAAPAIAAVAQAAAPVAAKAAPAVLAAKRPAGASPAITQPGGAGKKKQDAKEKKAAKGKFRETMWFKKGDLDAAAAEAAAQSKDVNAQDKADSLPIEERYTDDGSITTTDAARYSLKTGHTGAMPAMNDRGASSAVSEDELIGEMKGGSRTMLIVIAVGVVAVIGVIAAFVL